MYCGKNKTAIASQEQISSALLSLMETKPYADINICELCREAGISRQTFYTLFQSKDNVISYALQAHYCYTPGDTECSVSCQRGLSHEFSVYITERKKIIRSLVDNEITYLLHDSMHSSLLSCSCFLKRLPEERREYAADFIAGGFTGLARAYVRRGMTDDAAFLEETACTMLEFCGRTM